MLLILAAALCSCSGRAEEVRRQALVDIESATRTARESSGAIRPDSLAQAAWSEALVALDGAQRSLAACNEGTDSCLAASLSLLLDSDRKLLLLEQIDGVARPCDVAALQNQARHAAGLLYAHLYNEGTPPEMDDWRGPPTPRPPGVCPAG